MTIERRTKRTYTVPGIGKVTAAWDEFSIQLFDADDTGTSRIADNEADELANAIKQAVADNGDDNILGDGDTYE